MISGSVKPVVFKLFILGLKANKPEKPIKPGVFDSVAFQNTKHIKCVFELTSVALER